MTKSRPKETDAGPGTDADTGAGTGTDTATDTPKSRRVASRAV